MEHRPRWPSVCNARLDELLLIDPRLRYSEIGRLISEMPEARQIGLLLTREAIAGKVWRRKKKYGLLARPDMPMHINNNK